MLHIFCLFYGCLQIQLRSDFLVSMIPFHERAFGCAVGNSSSPCDQSWETYCFRRPGRASVHHLEVIKATLENIWCHCWWTVVMFQDLSRVCAPRARAGPWGMHFRGLHQAFLVMKGKPGPALCFLQLCPFHPVPQLCLCLLPLHQVLTFHFMTSG